MSRKWLENGDRGLGSNGLPIGSGIWRIDGHVIDDVTTSRDRESPRTWSQYAWGPLSRKRLENPVAMAHFKNRLAFIGTTSRVMMHSVSTNHCPRYISQLVQPVNNSSRRQGLRSSSSAKYVVQRTRTKCAVLSLSPVHRRGTIYLQIFDSSLTLLFLNANLKVTCFVLFLLSSFLRFNWLL